MKKFFTICLAVCMILCASASAFAMEVPVQTTVQNLNGTQQYIKIYTVDPSVDPEDLIEEDFDYEGFTYTYSSIIKAESWNEDEKEHSEEYSVETAKKDLSAVLEALPVTIEFDDGQYKGVLYLDHTTIDTKAAGFVNRSYTVTETKEIPNLDCSDMSYVPETTTKDGRTLQLSALEWQVQATTLVDDQLVPSVYKAVATYSAKANSSVATGYITTASYSGKVSCNELAKITYTVTYTGTPVLKTTTKGVISGATGSDEDYGPFASKQAMVIGCIILAALILALVFAVLEAIKRDKDLEGQEDGTIEPEASCEDCPKNSDESEDINLTEDDLLELLNEDEEKGDDEECEEKYY